MIHHQEDVFLSKIIKAASLWEDTPYQFMVHLAGTLLIGRARVTIKDLRPAIRARFPIFYLLRIGKLASVIGKDDREQLVKRFRTKYTIKGIDDTYYLT